MTRFHVGEYIRDELEARGWTTCDCAALMPGDAEINRLDLDLLLAAAEGDKGKGVRLARETAQSLEAAMGVSAETLLALDNAYHTKDAP